MCVCVTYATNPAAGRRILHGSSRVTLVGPNGAADLGCATTVLEHESVCLVDFRTVRHRARTVLVDASSLTRPAESANDMMRRGGFPRAHQAMTGVSKFGRPRISGYFHMEIVIAWLVILRRPDWRGPEERVDRENRKEERAQREGKGGATPRRVEVWGKTRDQREKTRREPLAQFIHRIGSVASPFEQLILRRLEGFSAPLDRSPFRLMHMVSVREAPCLINKWLPTDPLIIVVDIGQQQQQHQQHLDMGIMMDHEQTPAPADDYNRGFPVFQ